MEEQTIRFQSKNAMIEAKLMYDDEKGEIFRVTGAGCDGKPLEYHEIINDIPELDILAKYRYLWTGKYHTFTTALYELARNKTDMDKDIGEPVSFAEAFMFDGSDIPIMAKDDLLDIVRSDEYKASKDKLQIMESDCSGTTHYAIFFDKNTRVETTVFMTIGEAEAVLEKIKNDKFKIVKVVEAKNKKVEPRLERAREIAMRPTATIEELTDKKVAEEIREEVFSNFRNELKKLGFKTK